MGRAGLVMDARLRDVAREAAGFMPEDEGLALYEAAAGVATRGPLLEIGGYRGKSTIYLGAAALETGSILFSIDHHRGSEEHQPGEEYFDPATIDPVTGVVDTLPSWRRTIAAAGLEDVVVGIVGRSEVVARAWSGSLSLVFVDGGHSEDAAIADLDGWSPHVMPTGLLAIHDVFPDPRDGGRPPFEIYERALASGAFTEVSATGSLRILRKD